MTLKDGSREYPSWLELSQENGRLVAQFGGRWGNARPLPKAELSNGKLTFVSPKEEEGAQADLVFEGTLNGKELSGTVNGPDGKTWQWTGERAPALVRARHYLVNHSTDRRRSSRSSAERLSLIAPSPRTGGDFANASPDLAIALPPQSNLQYRFARLHSR